MLSEMHDKLSQAVKLYDQILTEQVMHPRWRTSRSPQQQYQPAPSNQWAPSQTPVPQGPGPSFQTPSAQYTSQSPQVQQEYQPPPPAQQQWNYAGQNQLNQQYLPSQAPVASSPPMQQAQQTQPLVSAPPPMAPTFAPPPMTAAISVPATPVVPVSRPQQSPQVPHTQVAPAPPSVPHSATPQPHHYNQGAQLGRSNTLAHPGYQPQYQQHQSQPLQYHQHKQQQNLMTNQQPNTLPQFPLVPTTAPMYDTSIHNGVVQSEQRKEAMLIDL